MKLLREIKIALRFSAAGLANTAFSAALVTLLIFLGLPYVIASTLSYCAGLLMSFFLNFVFTFRAPRRNRVRRAVMFIAMGLALTGLVQLMQYLLVEGAAMSSRDAIIAGMVVYAVLGYLSNRFIVFRSAS